MLKNYYLTLILCLCTFLSSLADESLVFLLDKAFLPTKHADPYSLDFSINYEDSGIKLAAGHYLPLCLYRNDAIEIGFGVLGGAKNVFDSKSSFDLNLEKTTVGSFFDFKKEAIGLRIEGFYEASEYSSRYINAHANQEKKDYQIPLEATLYYEFRTDVWFYFNVGKGIKSSRDVYSGMNYQVGLNFDFDLGHWGPFFAFDFQYYEKARDQIGLSIRMGVTLCRSSLYLRPRIFIEFREGPSFLLESFDRYEKSFQVGISLSY